MKLIKYYLSLAAIGLFSIAQAQSDSSKIVEKPWEFGGKPGLKWSRSSFSNWAAGGLGSSAIEFDSRAHAYYKDDKRVWKNDLEMAYGFNRRDTEGKHKIVDKFNFYSNYSWIGKREAIRYSVLLNVKSQFTDGYDYRSTSQWLLKSGFLAPGYVTLNVGFDYIKVKHLNIHFAPLSEKTTIVSESYYERKVINEYYGGNPIFIENSGVEEENEWDEPFEEGPTEEELRPIEERLDSTEVTYGLAWRDNSRFETGASFQILYDYPGILKNVDFKTRFDVFSSYTNFTKPDIDWEVWLSFNFNKYLAFTINTQLIYDSDILFDDGNGGRESKLQFRDFFGVGMSYTFK